MNRPECRSYTRREVMKKTLKAGGALAVPVSIRAASVGKGGSVAPSERIALGFIGIGMMGRGHLHLAAGYSDVQVAGVCDVDRWRRKHAEITVGKAYSKRNGEARYRGLKSYNDLRELVSREDIDAVFIATGDRWHVPAGVMAVKSGKDVYCEKPMSLTIGEARAMVDVARRHDAVFQTGLQQRSTPEFQKACELVRKGRLGKVRIVYVAFPGTSSAVNLPSEPVPEGLDWDLWLGPCPWRPFNSRFHHYGRPERVVPWHFCRDFGGGNMTSNAVHAFDVVQWGLGMDGGGPVEIVPPETGEVPSLTYKYPNGTLLQVTWKLNPQKHFVPKGWDPKTRIQNFGALFVGEEGWIHVGRSGYLKSYPEDLVKGKAESASIAHPVIRHHRNWLRCIRTRRRPACDVAIGCRSTIVSHLGCIAYWTGRKLKWDPAEERFEGDGEANRLRSRAMRAPWHL